MKRAVAFTWFVFSLFLTLVAIAQLVFGTDTATAGVGVALALLGFVAGSAFIGWRRS